MAVNGCAEKPVAGPGFRSVNWFGSSYAFTPQQAACIKVLWLNWLGGTPIVGEAQVLQIAHVKARSLREVFRAPPGNAAWGTMICDGDKRGTVRLAEPESGPSCTSSPPFQPFSGPDVAQ
jgi:hypothetical protein